MKNRKITLNEVDEYQKQLRKRHNYINDQANYNHNADYFAGHTNNNSEIVNPSLVVGDRNISDDIETKAKTIKVGRRLRNDQSRKANPIGIFRSLFAMFIIISAIINFAPRVASIFDNINDGFNNVNINDLPQFEFLNTSTSADFLDSINIVSEVNIDPLLENENVTQADILDYLNKRDYFTVATSNLVEKKVFEDEMLCLKQIDTSFFCGFYQEKDIFWPSDFISSNSQFTNFTNTIGNKAYFINGTFYSQDFVDQVRTYSQR